MNMIQSETGFFLPKRHDPRLRCWVGEHDAWTFYATARNDPALPRLASTGNLHLQLWHEYEIASLITPNMASGGHFELWTPDDHVRFCCIRGAANALRDMGLEPPCLPLLKQLHHMFVLGALVGVGSRQG